MPPLELWRVIVPMIVVPLLLLYCFWRKRADLQLVAICVLSMIVYGMIQDQFSVRLAPEYFTVAHPRIEGLEDPTLLGLTWGFLASWWGGLFMGMAVGLTATLGKDPPLSVRQVLPGIGLMMLAVVVGTLICGASGYFNARIAQVRLGGMFGEAVPEDRHVLFLTVACAYFGTYATAILSNIVLCIWIGRTRKKKLNP